MKEEPTRARKDVIHLIDEMRLEVRATQQSAPSKVPSSMHPTRAPPSTACLGCLHTLMKVEMWLQIPS